MIRPASTARQLCRGILALAICLPVLGQSRAPVPDPIALLHVSLAADAGEGPQKTLLLRDGRIEAVLADGGQIPAEYRQIDGTGLVAAPAFVDAYTHAGVVAPEIQVDQDRPVDTGASIRTDMRQAGRKGVRASYLVADDLELADDVAEKFRKSGFGVLLAAPHGELMAGQSAVILARNAAARDQILRSRMFQHTAFRASGSGYPSTLMGYHAALRQLFLDAARHALLQEREAAGKSGPRAPYDKNLEQVQQTLRGKQLLVCEAESDRDVRRWMRLAEEFKFNMSIAGGRDAWQAADQLAAAGVPVLLTLNWGDEVKDPAEKDKKKKDKKKDEKEDEPAEAESADEGEAADEEALEVETPMDFDYQEPRAVLDARRVLWEERRDGALILDKAGVTLAFGSGGDSSKDLLERVRTLVEQGFPREKALAALTSGGASLLGVSDELGSLQAGYSATLCLWTGDPLAEKSQVRWAFVDGFLYEYEVKEIKDAEGPDDGVDLSGVWVVEDKDSEDGQPMTLTISMDEDGVISGKVAATNPMDGSAISADVSGTVSGKSFEIKMTFVVGGMQVDLVLDGKLKSGSLSGSQTLRFGGQEQESRFEGERKPLREQKTQQNKEVQR
ncbi:MAG: imidazolonepropionase-like amidohydrolase [Planctomycetota bacterium]|jgi:imidazolonepropionase-like amidohydrolase